MSTKPVEFHPESLDELIAAVHWYHQRSPSAAIRFVAEIDRAMELIAEAPDRWFRVATERADIWYIDSHSRSFIVRPRPRSRFSLQLTVTAVQVFGESGNSRFRCTPAAIFM